MTAGLITVSTCTMLPREINERLTSMPDHNCHPSDISLNRRQFVAAGAAAAVALPAVAAPVKAAFARGAARPFRFSLNMSTIRGQNPTVEQEIDIAGKAGYDAIEPWLNKLHAYADKGGSLKDLRKRITDHGLSVESAIGFPTWVVDDDAKRAAGFEQAKKDMELLVQIGAKRMAAPPAGMKRGETLDLQRAAERYRQMLELGDQMGIIVELEFWGSSAAIGTLSTSTYIAMAAGHPKACILGDVYHLYKGGSPIDGLRLLGPDAMPVIHANDYPADPPRETITDASRVYPGDGIAPYKDILRIFRAIGAAPVLSLELFNRDYWKQDPLEVARTGLRKMKKMVAKAG